MGRVCIEWPYIVQRWRIGSQFSFGIGTRIEPGETITRTYEIRAGTDGLAPGDYVIPETLTSRLAEEPPSETIEWTVGFTLTEAIHDETWVDHFERANGSADEKG